MLLIFSCSRSLFFTYSYFYIILSSICRNFLEKSVSRVLADIGEHTVSYNYLIKLKLTLISIRDINSLSYQNFLYTEKNQNKICKAKRILTK